MREPRSNTALLPVLLVVVAAALLITDSGLVKLLLVVVALVILGTLIDDLVRATGRWMGEKRVAAAQVIRSGGFSLLREAPRTAQRDVQRSKLAETVYTGGFNLLRSDKTDSEADPWTRT